MKNPWLKLPNKKPYILKIDRDDIEKYNGNSKSSDRIHEELLPEPFLGNPKSPIILLNLNPGFCKRDIKFHRQNQFKKLARANLLHKRSVYPFYLLNPELETSPGYKWWDKRLHELIEDFGRRTVARKICCIEFAPYHSQKFKRLNGILPSQKYNFHLVRQALKNNALIIVMRSLKYWQKEVPELLKYKKKYQLGSYQAAYVTKNNLKRGYNILTKILRS